MADDYLQNAMAGAHGVPAWIPKNGIPQGAGVTTMGHEALPVVSDVPWKPDWRDRPICAGTRRDGHPCGQRVNPDESVKFCSAHLDQA